MKIVNNYANYNLENQRHKNITETWFYINNPLFGYYGDSNPCIGQIGKNLRLGYLTPGCFNICPDFAFSFSTISFTSCKSFFAS